MSFSGIFNGLLGQQNQNQNQEPPAEIGGEPIVWQRGDKYARGVFQEASAELPMRTATAETPRSADPPAATAETPRSADPAAAPKPVTLDVIIDHYRLTARTNTHRHLFVGRLVNTWIRRQPERPASEQLPRAAAMIVIEERIAAEKLEGCRPNRDLKCYHASRLLGGDADGLAISSVREMLRLIERVTAPDGERWQLVPAHAAAARELWARMLADHLTREAVRAEVDRILPPPAPKQRQLWSRQLQTVLRIFPTLSADELIAARIELLRCLREEKARGASPAAA